MGKKSTPRAAAPTAPKEGWQHLWLTIYSWLQIAYRWVSWLPIISPLGRWLLKGTTLFMAYKFEEFVNRAASPLPSPRIKLWLAGFFHPQETYAKVEKTATLVGIAANLLIFYFAYSLIFFLFMLALTSSLSPEDLLAMGLQKSPDLAKIALDSLAISPVISVFSALIAFAVVFASARMLGGNGTYVKQANSMQLVLCGSNTIILVFMCVAFAIFMPAFILKETSAAGAVVSLFTAIASVPILAVCAVIFLYSIYAYYIVVRQAHGLSPLRAAGAIAIAAAIIVLLDMALTGILA